MANKILGKTELTDAIADQAGISKKDAQQALKVVLDGIQSSLQGGNDINITGFGKFKVTHRAARKGRNPGTGEELDIPASNQVTFSAGAGLKQAVNS